MDSKSVLLIRWWFLLFGVISSLVLELHAQSGRYTIYQEVGGTLTICNNLVVNNVDASSINISTALENNILGENTTVLMDNQQDFTIKPGSVAVNAGDNTCVTWLNGMSREKRRQQNVVDIGAFEVYYKYEDTLFTIFQEMAGALTLCNNIIINNVADSLTNVVSIPINNIIGENTQVFTDNYLDFSIKPGSSAVNAGERLYVNWSYDMCREKRTQQDRVDIGAFETYYRHEDTLYLIYHEGVNTLSFCNNLIIINVADSLTNVTTMPANNITGEEISVFTDNYLDFGLKPGSIAVNSGEDECPIWVKDLRGLYRKWGVVDVGAYEAKSLIGAGYTVEQEDLGTLLLYNNIVIQNPGSIGACNINAVDSSINLLNDVGNVFVGNDDYSLGETSPAVNMGDNQYVVFLNDMKGESRIACEEPVDLGAYEVQALHNIYLTDVVCGVGQPYHRYGFDIDSVPAGETTFMRSVMSGLVCDSVYQLTLTGNHSYLYQDYATICGNEAYVWQGHEHVTIGQLAAGYYIYWDSLTTHEGCDSVYQLNLTINPSYSFLFDDAICESEAYVWSGHEHVTIGQLAAGSYTFYDSLTTVNGCDSVVILHLTVHEQYLTTLNQSICLGESYIDNGFNVTPSIAGLSTYQRVVPSDLGCDSTIILNLNVNEIQDCYSSSCPEFTDLSAPGVKCQYGSFANPLQYTGIAVGRHTVITQQGSDPNTGHQLPFLPSGESRVVKLGNERTGAEAEAVTYQFTVNPDYAILLLKFAVVFEDPGHPSPDQPRFVVRVLNSAGQLVESCAEYDVTAAGDIPGFQTYTSGWRNVRWRPWTNVGIDLSDYAGQQIRLQFVTYDCNWHGHFGYAYFTASCMSNKLALSGCNGSQVTLVAPSGFESYAWDNGSTSSSATYTVNGTTTANCLITSATGCQFTLSGTLSSQSGLPTSSTTVYDTICEGDSYNAHYFDLPAQFETGTHTFRNTFFNTANCTGGNVTTTLYLTVLPRYNHIYDVACQGTNYNAHGFHYTNLQTGSFTDTLVTVLSTGCDLVTILHLTVNPSFNLNNSLRGPNSVCRNEVLQYALLQAEGLATFHWNVPTGVNILTGQGTSEANLYFTDDAPNPAVISLTGVNGCGSGSIPLNVTHYPTYHIFFQDSICTGNDYHRYGFDLARQDSTGWYTFTDRYTTAHGCDSLRILQLLVTGTPSLTTLAQPAEICIGQSATIHAMGENACFVYEVPPVAIGDILCTDNSIVKPSAWPVEGKTAMGIVFYVDNTGEHGWAVHLHDQGVSVQWAKYNYYGMEVNTLPAYLSFTQLRDALMDIDGHYNTQLIREAGDSISFPAAWVVDFDNGWYLPALGQLRLIVAEIETLNISLHITEGTQFPPIFYWWFYWSSTQSNQGDAWRVYSNGITDTYGKRYFYRVRSVRNF